MTSNGVAELLADVCGERSALIEFGLGDEEESALAVFEREVTREEQAAVMAIAPPRWPCCPTDSTRHPAG